MLAIVTRKSEPNYYVEDNPNIPIFHKDTICRVANEINRSKPSGFFLVVPPELQKQVLHKNLLGENGLFAILNRNTTKPMDLDKIQIREGFGTPREPRVPCITIVKAEYDYNERKFGGGEDIFKSLWRNHCRKRLTDISEIEIILVAPEIVYSSGIHRDDLIYFNYHPASGPLGLVQQVRENVQKMNEKNMRAMFIPAIDGVSDGSNSFETIQATVAYWLKIYYDNAELHFDPSINALDTQSSGTDNHVNLVPVNSQNFWDWYYFVNSNSPKLRSNRVIFIGDPALNELWAIRRQIVWLFDEVSFQIPSATVLVGVDNEDQMPHAKELLRPLLSCALKKFARGNAREIEIPSLEAIISDDQHARYPRPNNEIGWLSAPDSIDLDFIIANDSSPKISNVMCMFMKTEHLRAFQSRHSITTGSYPNIMIIDLSGGKIKRLATHTSN